MTKGNSWHAEPKKSPQDQARRKALAEWRGVDLEANEMTDSFRSIEGILPRVISRIKLDRKRLEAEIVLAWPDLMSSDIAEHAKPSGLWRNTLFVSVDSDAWLAEIVRFHRDEIMEKLRASFGSKMITKVSYRVG